MFGEAISFKDPDGYIVLSGEKVYRFISNKYAPCYEHLMNSGLYDRLTSEGLLIAHKEAVVPELEKDSVYKVIEPERIDIITYPYEWSFEQWKATLLAQLKINRIALEFGMILKDSTPFNFTFYQGRIVLFDTSSFEFYADGQPWKAYKQFCEEFLGPLALMKYRQPLWSQLYSASIRGFDLPFVSQLLPFSSKWNMTCLVHLHLHSRYKNKDSNGKGNSVSQSGFNKQKLLLLWQMMEKGVAHWSVTPDQKGFWSGYYEDLIESQLYMEDKKDRLNQWLQQTSPERVIDLGANTGVFSFIAAAHCKEVVAVESDAYCVGKLYADIVKAGAQNIIPVLADLTCPSPGLGWNNEERPALVERVNGDLVLALALIHHLCITFNVPLTLVAKFFHRLTTEYAIVEFIPKSDGKIVAMLKNREDIFDSYTERDFRASFSPYFELVEEHSCRDSGRKLFLWRKR
jgi:ribosomal protein L11 methylase PrmA